MMTNELELQVDVEEVEPKQPGKPTGHAIT